MRLLRYLRLLFSTDEVRSDQRVEVLPVEAEEVRLSESGHPTVVKYGESGFELPRDVPADVMVKVIHKWETGRTIRHYDWVVKAIVVLITATAIHFLFGDDIIAWAEVIKTVVPLFASGG